MKNSKKVLFLIAHHGFRDKELTWVTEQLDYAEIDYEIASSHLSEAEGKFGLVVNPDILVTRAVATDYSAIVVVGEEESAEFLGIGEAVKLVHAAVGHGVIVCSMGAGVQLLIAGNAVNGKKITGPAEMATQIEHAGGFFTGKIVERDGNVISVNGPYGVREFAEELVKVLGTEENSLEGRKYLR